MKARTPAFWRMTLAAGLAVLASNAVGADAFAANGADAPTTSVGFVTGQYKTASGTSYTTCGLNASANDTPRNDESGADVRMTTTVTCSTSNIPVTGNSTLYNADTGTPLYVASSFPGALSTGQSSGAYFDSNDADDLFYQAHVVLTLPSGVTGQWDSAVGGANCVGITTTRVDCYPNVTFSTDGPAGVNGLTSNPTTLPDLGAAFVHEPQAGSPGLIYVDTPVAPAVSGAKAAPLARYAVTGCVGEFGRKVTRVGRSLAIEYGGGLDCTYTQVSVRLKSVACLKKLGSRGGTLECVTYGYDVPPDGPISRNSFVQDTAYLRDTSAARRADYRIDIEGYITLANPNATWGEAPGGCKIDDPKTVHCFIGGTKFKGRPRSR